MEWSCAGLLSRRLRAALFDLLALALGGLEPLSHCAKLSFKLLVLLGEFEHVARALLHLLGRTGSVLPL